MDQERHVDAEAALFVNDSLTHPDAPPESGVEPSETRIEIERGQKRSHLLSLEIIMPQAQPGPRD